MSQVPSPILPLTQTSILAVTEAKQKRQKSGEHAVAQKQSLDLFATNLESSPLAKKSVKRARITRKKSKYEVRAALYIVGKYVDPTKVDYKRDITIAYGLLKTFPDIEFWKALPIKNLVTSLAIIASKEAKRKLSFLYKTYKERLAIQKNILVKNSPTYKLGEKVGEDYQVKEKKPRSILEFCRE